MSTGHLYEVWEENLGRESSEEIEALTGVDAAIAFRSRHSADWRDNPRWGEKRILVVALVGGETCRRFEAWAVPAIEFRLALIPLPPPPVEPGHIPF